jgi:hypothetical protein
MTAARDVAALSIAKQIYRFEQEASHPFNFVCRFVARLPAHDYFHPVFVALATASQN